MDPLFWVVELLEQSREELVQSQAEVGGRRGGGQMREEEGEERGQDGGGQEMMRGAEERGDGECQPVYCGGR